ncbi:MAG: HNH endonuclease [Ignavibacterium sp.]|nr:HNH endonuclease [Ignavibacterium sp.]
MNEKEQKYKVYDKFGHFLSHCTEKRAKQLIQRGSAIQTNKNEIILIITRKDLKRIRSYVYERDNYTCYYCGIVCDSNNISLDHLYPRSRGGSDFPENLVTSCCRCNELKRNMSFEEFFLSLYAYVLFHHLWWFSKGGLNHND